MAYNRIIPILLLKSESLVKTVRFKNESYIGDPLNTVRIFNELEVDELCFLDISASLEGREPNYKILGEIASECFMPLSYGGGVTSVDQAKKIFSLGFEKVIINSSNFSDQTLVPSIKELFGSQSIIGSIDVKKNWLGCKQVVSHSSTKKTNKNPIEWAIELERYGVGELLITAVDNEGTWEGYDYDLINEIADRVNVPVIANGGCGSVNDLVKLLENKSINAAGVGSMVVYQKKGMGVLINFPDKEQLEKVM